MKNFIYRDELDIDDSEIIDDPAVIRFMSKDRPRKEKKDEKEPKHEHTD